MRRLFIIGAALLTALALTVPAMAGPQPPGCWDFSIEAYGSGDGIGDGDFTTWGQDGSGGYAVLTNGVQEMVFTSFDWTGVKVGETPGYEHVIETYDLGAWSFTIRTKGEILVSSPDGIWQYDGGGKVINGDSGTVDHFGAFDIWGLRISVIEGTVCY